MSNHEEKALPFFARYLEGQFCEDLSEEEMDNIQGGLKIRPPVITRKHQDCDWIAVTLKYPSDNEDGSGEHPIKPPIAMTKKYPSDHEDISAGEYH
jgi:hypothetical protein